MAFLTDEEMDEQGKWHDAQLVKETRRADLATQIRRHVTPLMGRYTINLNMKPETALEIADLLDPEGAN